MITVVLAGFGGSSPANGTFGSPNVAVPISDVSPRRIIQRGPLIGFSGRLPPMRVNIQLQRLNAEAGTVSMKASVHTPGRLLKRIPGRGGHPAVRSAPSGYRLTPYGRARRLRSPVSEQGAVVVEQMGVIVEGDRRGGGAAHGERGDAGVDGDPAEGGEGGFGGTERGAGQRGDRARGADHDRGLAPPQLGRQRHQRRRGGGRELRPGLRAGALRPARHPAGEHAFQRILAPARGAAVTGEDVAGVVLLPALVDLGPAERHGGLELTRQGSADKPGRPDAAPPQRFGQQFGLPPASR